MYVHMWGLRRRAPIWLADQGDPDTFTKIKICRMISNFPWDRHNTFINEAVQRLPPPLRCLFANVEDVFHRDLRWNASGGQRLAPPVVCGHLIKEASVFQVVNDEVVKPMTPSQKYEGTFESWWTMCLR